MINSRYILATCMACCLHTLAISTVSAVPVSGQGTWETTLQGRDLDGNVTTFEAYYDTTLNITWLADANHAFTSGFDADGRMAWVDANAWAAGLSVNGITGWRLPTMSPVNGTSFDVTRTTDGSTDYGTATTTTNGLDGGWRDGSNTPVSEMGHMFYVTLGNLGRCDPTLPWCTIQSGWGLANTGPFANIQLSNYWSDTQWNPTTSWDLNLNAGSQNLNFSVSEFFAWAVHDGDIMAKPPTPPAARFLAPGWKAANYITLSIPTRAIAFDSSDNLYIEDTGDDGSGIVEVLQLAAASGYTASTSYASYASPVYTGVTGLSFDRLGSLYVAERDASGDAGIIRKIDVVAQTLAGVVMAFDNHRPTGIDADRSGNVFYSGRKESDGRWGKIFRIDGNTIRTTLLDNTVATGIAVDTSGNIFISTPQRDDLPLQNNSIYRFTANDPLNPELIATFDGPGGELTFDISGNLYMIADDKVNIIKVSRTDAKTMSWLPLLLD